MNEAIAAANDDRPPIVTAKGDPASQLENGVEDKAELQEAADHATTEQQEETSPESALTSSDVTAARTDDPDFGRVAERESNPEADWPLRAAFVLSGKTYDVELDETRLLWWPISQGKTDKSTKAVRAVEAEEKVVVADIIGAKPRHRTVRTQAGTQMVPAGFTVFYACKKKSPKWREKRIYFDHIDINVCRRWAAQIEIMAKGSSSRPKMLKVFVNPAAGKKNGVRIFEQEIAPILKICDVRCEVTVTEQPGHLRELVQQIDLDSYDGIVIIGGDGTVNELIDGLLKSSCLGSTPDRVSPCDIRIGIIPAGTNNQIANAVYGIANRETSILHIVIGNCRSFDILSMAHRGKPLRFGITCGYGFPAKFLQSKKHGWLSKAGLSSLPAVKQHKVYPCEVHFLLVDDKETDKEGKMTNVYKVAEWKAVKGQLSAVVVSASRMVSEAHPNGLWPEMQDNDGYGRLVVVEECSRSQIMSYHKRLSKSRKRPEDLDFVHSYKVRAVRLRPLKKEASPESNPAETQAASKDKQSNSKEAVDPENSSKETSGDIANVPSSPIPDIVIDENARETTKDQAEIATEQPSSEQGATSVSSQSPDEDSKETDKKVGNEIEEIGKTSQPSLLNPSPQPKRRGFTATFRQRLATFSARHATRSHSARPHKKTASLEISSTAAGDIMVRQRGAKASSPIPPGGPPLDYNDSDVNPEETSPWVMDGELIREPFVDIRIHNNLVSIFVSEDESADHQKKEV